MTQISAVHDTSRFRVGTLIYSRAGLVTLVAWLLWGDFVYTLMENVMPSLLPMLLRDNGASNQAIAFIVSSIYMVVNAVANPIISYKSDRFRSRWGRRRPFILVTTPFVLLLLDYWPLQRFPLKTQDSRLKTALPLLREKWPFFALSAASSTVR